MSKRANDLLTVKVYYRSREARYPPGDAAMSARLLVGR